LCRLNCDSKEEKGKRGEGNRNEHLGLLDIQNSNDYYDHGTLGMAGLIKAEAWILFSFNVYE